MGIESYGGCCPKCKRGMFNKFESSGYGLMFDACPWCEFMYAVIDGEVADENKQVELWSDIAEHHGVETVEELRKLDYVKEYMTEEESEFYPSVFVHDDITDAHA